MCKLLEVLDHPKLIFLIINDFFEIWRRQKPFNTSRGIHSPWSSVPSLVHLWGSSTVLSSSHEKFRIACFPLHIKMLYWCWISAVSERGRCIPFMDTWVKTWVEIDAAAAAKSLQIRSDQISRSVMSDSCIGLGKYRKGEKKKNTCSSATWRLLQVAEIHLI